MRYIGIDPSLTRTGLACVVDDRVVDWTVVQTKPTGQEKALDLAKRLDFIRVGVQSFVAKHPDSMVAVEAQVASSFGRSSLRNVGMLMAAYGTVLGALPSEPFVLTPATIRRRLFGHEKVEKGTVRECCTSHFSSFPSLPRSRADQEAVWDAVAVVLALEPDGGELDGYHPTKR